MQSCSELNTLRRRISGLIWRGSDKRSSKGKPNTTMCVLWGGRHTEHVLELCLCMKSLELLLQAVGFLPDLKTSPLYIHVRKIASRILDFSISLLLTRTVYKISNSVYNISYCSQKARALSSKMQHSTPWDITRVILWRMVTRFHGMALCLGNHLWETAPHRELVALHQHKSRIPTTAAFSNASSAVHSFLPTNSKFHQPKLLLLSKRLIPRKKEQK